MFRQLIMRSLRQQQTNVLLRQAATKPATAALKTLEPATKYTGDETSRILDAINGAISVEELQRFDISKGRSQTIRSWRNRNGPLSSIEQLLELDGFGVKNLDKLCASILQRPATKISSPDDDDRPDPDAKRSTQRIQQFTTPLLAEALRQRIRSCTAVHVGISSVTWARLELLDANAPGGAFRLTDWRLCGISDKRMHLSGLCETVLDIVAELPAADAYVLESPRIAQQGPPGTPALININVQMSQIIAMVAMELSMRGRLLADGDDGLDAKRVLFMRQLLAPRLFQTVVGLERISTASVVSALFEQSETTAPGVAALDGELQVSEELRLAYNGADGYYREYMGQALQLALAFQRLCVLRCPDSLAAISRQRKRT